MNFSWTLFDTTVCFYECGIIMLLLVRKLGFTPKKRFILLGYLGIACTDALLRGSGLSPVPSLIILIAATVLYSVFVFDGRMSRRIIWGIISCGVGQLCVNLTIAIFAIAGYTNLDDFLIPSHLRFTILIAYLMNLTLTYFVLVNNRPQKASLYNLPFRVAMLGIFVFGLLSTMQISSQFVFRDSTYVGLTPVSDNLLYIAVVITAIFLAMLCLFEYTSVLAQKNRETETELKYQKWQNEHLEQVRIMYQALSAWKHDAQNHMDILLSHLKNRRYDEMNEYLDQMHAEMLPFMQIYNTGNSVADAVLSNKLFIAQNKGIQVNAVAQLPGKLIISDVQLGSVLSNLLDNALEAQESVAEPYINVSIRQERGMLYIKIENSAIGQYLYRDNKLASSKKGEDRGLGLVSSGKIIESAGGVMDIRPETDRFTVKILLPLTAESKVS